MKDAIKSIVGKTISSVVVGSSDVSPNEQVFLVFDDGTSFELYGTEFTCAGGLDKGGVEEVSTYAKKCGAQQLEIYPES